MSWLIANKHMIPLWILGIICWGWIGWMIPAYGFMVPFVQWLHPGIYGLRIGSAVIAMLVAIMCQMITELIRGDL